MLPKGSLSSGRTLIVSCTFQAAVSITETLSELEFATNSCPPSAESSRSDG